MRAIIRLCFLLVLINPVASRAQIDDFGAWTSVSVEHRFTRKFSSELTQSLRLYKDLYQVDQFYSQISGTYSLKKYLRLSLGYRFSRKDREGYYSTRHRLQADLSFRYKYKWIIGQLRERIQRQVTDPYASENGEIPVWVWRNRLTLKADLNKKYSPYASVEFFYLLDNAKEDPFGLIRMRYEAGLEYEFNRIHSINPFVLLQYGLPFKGNRLVVGFSYTLNI